MGFIKRGCVVALISALSACTCGSESAEDAGLTPYASVTDAAIPDASIPDASIPDASIPDASIPDASIPDASIPDAGIPDASIPDASIPDASIPDASIPDAGIPDASIPDASIPDASIPDASIPDAGIPDAGLADAGSLSRWIPDYPQPRIQATLTWDPDGQRLLLFGGRYANQWLADLWAWNGNAWSELQAPSWPPSRGAHDAAWDAARHRLVLFGGARLVWNVLAGDFVAEYFSDTWEFDGTLWTQRFPAHRPPAGGGSRLVYDATRQYVLLHNSSGQTWKWDGTDWTQLSVVAPNDVGPLLAWDDARGKVVLFGAVTATTWEWDGVAWSQRLPSRSPPAMQQAAMAWDGARQRVVLVGGARAYTTGLQLTQTWEWDGNTWTELSPPSGNPRFGGEHALAWDPVRNRLVLYGDIDLRGEVWERDGTQWSVRVERPRGSTTSVAYDSARAEFVRFGGRSDFISGPPYPLHDETWVFRSGTWSRRTPATSPSPRVGASLAWDSASQRVILFGGTAVDGQALSDTWAWDGTSWTPLVPTSSPPPARCCAAFVTDADGGRAVLAGGVTDLSGAYPLSDAWEWRGGNWLPVPGALPFAGRSEGTFDSVRRRFVFTQRGRLFEWDGASPLAADAGVTTLASDFLSVVFDPQRQCVIAHNITFPLDATWTWDGQAFTSVPMRPSPPQAPGGTLAWDPVRQRVVMFWATTWSLER